MELPNEEELQTLRKSLKKRNLPRIFDGMWCSEPGIGGVKCTSLGTDFDLEWVSFANGNKSALKHAQWNTLCTDSKLEMQRLEIGFVISSIVQLQGQKVMQSIGHPTEAINEAKPYLEAADNWRHWAIVKANHMHGL